MVSKVPVRSECDQTSSVCTMAYRCTGSGPTGTRSTTCSSACSVGAQLPLQPPLAAQQMSDVAPYTMLKLPATAVNNTGLRARNSTAENTKERAVHADAVVQQRPRARHQLQR